MLKRINKPSDSLDKVYCKCTLCGYVDEYDLHYYRCRCKNPNHIYSDYGEQACSPNNYLLKNYPYLYRLWYKVTHENCDDKNWLANETGLASFLDWLDDYGYRRGDRLIKLDKKLPYNSSNCILVRKINGKKVVLEAR